MHISYTRVIHQRSWSVTSPGVQPNVRVGQTAFGPSIAGPSASAPREWSGRLWPARIWTRVRCFGWDPSIAGSQPSRPQVCSSLGVCYYPRLIHRSLFRQGYLMKFCVTAIYHFDGWVRVGLPWDVVGVGRGGLGAVAHINDTSKICGGIGWGGKWNNDVNN